jgi:hypothetical protein
MNRPPSASNFAPGPLLLAALVVAAALTRLLPHPPNFSPVEAIALFGGAYFASRAWAVLVPLAGLLLSDLALGAIKGDTYLQYFTSSTYLPSLLAIYACVALCSLLGFGLRGRVDGARVLGYSLAGSVVFFALSNLATWLTAIAVPGYPACNTGLAACYVAALPFFQWTVLGTLSYSALLFGGFALLRRKLPALRAQTV